MPTRLLLIEAESDITLILHVLFSAAGYECVSVAAVGEALALLGRAPPPDVILLGVTPYGADAPTLCRALKVLYPAAPLLVLTTETRAPLRDGCLAAGADGVVMKPFDPDALEADVARLVARRAPGRRLAVVP